MAGDQPALAEARRWFAEELRAICHLGDERVVGDGPWRIQHFADGYWTTSDDDPRRLYHNVLAALDETRGLNTGEPALWARHFDQVGIAAGSRILQIGAGSGYFTAILAELAGSSGRVDGIEIDEPLAVTAQRNLEPWPTASVRVGDATATVEGQWDLIVAFAGATALRIWWLETLAEGGCLLQPMTASRERGGFMPRLERHGDRFAACSAGWVGFYPCAGARDESEEAAREGALNDRGGQRALRSLRRDPHDGDETCWLHRDSWCLSKRELH